MITLIREFAFTAKHENIDHDHVLRIHLEGEPDKHGRLLDFAAFDKIVQPIIALVSGKNLETLYERCSMWEAMNVALNPTCENLVIWFSRRLELLKSARVAKNDGQLGEVTPLRLARLELKENARTWVEWRPPHD